MYDDNYFKIVYTSKNTTNDSFVQINNRYVSFFNDTKSMMNEFNISSFNTTQLANLKYAGNMMTYLDQYYVTDD